MKKLFVLIGVQGAGKTTALKGVKSAKVLRPSTSRQKRQEETDEYHFETEWVSDRYAWEIKPGADNYGMRLSELESAGGAAITVFDPRSIAVLNEKKKVLGFEVVTIGLDTIKNCEEQARRVNNNTSRMAANQREFDAQRDVVLHCDVVLEGDADLVLKGLEATIRIVRGRGGIIDKDSIINLIRSGTLLKDADVGQAQTASYDLRLADKYWCQGKYITLDDKNELVVIPAYSFVLVQSKEEACLPRFLAGNFDLTVSMFFDGLILSNGPQVDPGYRGSLFCMLYNTSDNEIALNRGIDFATIQFSTTAIVADGYDGQYQGKLDFKDFLTGKVANSKGGRILERMNEMGSNLRANFTSLKGEVKDDWKSSRDHLFVIAGLWATLITAVAIAILGYTYSMADKASAGADKAAAAIDAMQKEKENIEATLRQLDVKKENRKKETQISGANQPVSVSTDRQ